MKNRFVILLFSMVFVPVAYSQKKGPYRVMDKSHSIAKAYGDTLTSLYNRYFNIPDLLYSGMIDGTIPNPRYFKLFVPLTYYNSPVEQSFYPKWKSAVLKEPEYPVQKLFPTDWALYNQTIITDERVNRVLLNIYVAHPGWVKTTEKQLRKRRAFKKEVTEKLPPKINMIDLFTPDPVETDVGTAELYIRKPNFWTFGGSGALQFTQNYVSDNWYKGGESSNALMSGLILSLKYDDRQRVEFENKLEVKLGFMTTPSDTVHKYKTNNDKFRLSSKLGVKAVARWYYTVAAEFETQFFSFYKTNTDIEKSGLFSPADFKATIGMDYKLNKKKVDLSIMLSPLAYRFRHINTKVNPKDYGMKEGETILNEIGSTFQTSMKWNILPSIVWDSRLVYFTNYKNVQAEWENTINFVLNRYLSTQLFVHVRYDDSATPIDGCNYFQIKELLSFGINYTW